MDITERKTVVKAMEVIARCINDENIFEAWLSLGVADGDIDYDTPIEDIDDDYIEDQNFAELMGLFLRLMRKAKKDGLYSDGIKSSDY